MESPTLTICPCCGAGVSADLRVAPCGGCGALSVGPPLARPETVLPAYGLTAAVAAAGALVALVFAAATLLALLQQKPVSLSFWNVVAAAETAAWRLKFVLLPVALAAFVGGARALAHVSRAPERFALVRFALGGLATSATIAVALAALVVVTVPERLRQRELAREAAQEAEAYTPVRVLLEYQRQYGTLPASADDLGKLPDPDGSVARAARMLAPGAAQYEPASTIASLPAPKSLGRRSTSVTVRPVALRSDDALPAEPLAFTNYTLRLAGEDRKLCTADDLFVRDGLVTRTPPPSLKPCTPPVEKKP